MLQLLCAREELHFDDAQLRKQLVILDESEWDDRIEQQNVRAIFTRIVAVL